VLLDAAVARERRHDLAASDLLDRVRLGALEALDVLEGRGRDGEGR
jgi:hypothetical protein